MGDERWEIGDERWERWENQETQQEVARDETCLNEEVVKQNMLGEDGIFEHVELLRSLQDPDPEKACKASKELLEIAEKTKMSEKISRSVLEAVVNGLRSEHSDGEREVAEDKNDLFAVLSDITSVIFWIAYGNEDNQRNLLTIPHFLPLMVQILGKVNYSGRVMLEYLGAWSKFLTLFCASNCQVVFADPETAIQVVGMNGDDCICAVSLGSALEAYRSLVDRAGFL
eukprot:768526-Hanusia_phi.AAC.3